MSLSTILEIGEKLKSAPNGIRHHKYIRPCPPDSKNLKVLRLNIPVKTSGDELFIDLMDKGFRVIQKENLIGHEMLESKLLFLRYKTSDKDSSPAKFFFGDIFYSITRPGNEGDKNYSIEKDSLQHGKQVKERIEKTESSKNSLIVRFFDCFEKNKSKLIALLQYNEGISYFLSEVKEEEPEVGIRELASDRGRLRLYTAKACFTRLKGSKKFKEIFKDENPTWEEVQVNEQWIGDLVKETIGAVYLHFDFSGKSWYEQVDDMALIFNSFIRDFSDVGKTRDFHTFRTMLFRGLCSGDEKNDKQFPNFSLGNKHKSKAFSKEEIENLFYGVGLLDRGIPLSRGSDVRMIVLPRGDNLTVSDYERFYGRLGSKDDSSNEEKVEEAETTLERANADKFMDFLELPGEFDQRLLVYDVLLALKGSQTTVDMVEIQGIQKSFLRQVYARIREKKNQIYDKIGQTRETSKYSVGIYLSLLRLLGKIRIDIDEKGKLKKYPFEASSKLNTHLLAVIPKNFTATYFSDDRLLPLTLERIELFVRNGILLSQEPYYATMLLYDLEFLLSIQNTPTDNQNFEKIMQSTSYELGKNLGRFALFFKPSKSKEDYTPINSFDQEYVGNLRRHIGQISDLKRFSDMLFEKYYQHQHRKKFIHWDIQNGTVVENITRLASGITEATYDKNECAFGFFESYFERYKEKTLSEKLENLLEKHKDDETHAELVQLVQQALDQYNIQN